MGTVALNINEIQTYFLTVTKNNISCSSKIPLKTFVSHNILYKSFKILGDNIQHYFVHFQVLNSLVRPNYLNFLNPYNFENRITKSRSTGITHLSGILFIFFFKKID